VQGAADLQIGPASFERGATPDYGSFYDDETRQLIADVFVRDFDRYGYDRALAPLKASGAL
jgi:hypothetical protein